MLKRKNFILVLALAFTALLLIPFTVSAAPAAKPHKALTTTAYYAFTALITAGDNKSASLTGSLVLQSNQAGKITGTYRAPDNSKLPVTGMAKRDGSIDFTILEGNTPFLHGLGKLNAQQQYVGTFRMDHKGKMSSGIWSTMSVMPEKTWTLSFAGSVEKGTDKNVLLAGAIVVDMPSLSGSFLEASGTSFPVQVHTKTANNVNKIQVIIGNNSIIAVGIQIDNPSNKKNKGYGGNFNGPAKDDHGIWEGFVFAF
jgi:hypothetical protein